MILMWILMITLLGQPIKVANSYLRKDMIMNTLSKELFTFMAKILCGLLFIAIIGPSNLFALGDVPLKNSSELSSDEPILEFIQNSTSSKKESKFVKYNYSLDVPVTVFESLSKIEDEQATYWDSRLVHAESFYMQGDYEKALEAFARIKEESNDKDLSAQVDIQLFYILVDSAKHAEALSLLDRVTSEKYSSPVDCFQMIRVFYTTRNYTEAQKHLDVIKDKYENSFWSQLATIYKTTAKGNKSQLDRQLKLLKENYSEHQGYEAEVFSLYEYYVEIGDFSQSIHVLKKCLGTMETIEPKLRVINSLILDYKTSLAQQKIIKLIKSHSDEDAIVQVLVELAADTGQMGMPSIEKMIYEWIHENKADTEVAIWSQAYFVRDDIKHGNADKAAVKLKHLILKNKEHSLLPRTLYQIANSYAQHKQPVMARTLYHYVYNNWSGDSRALWAKMGYAMSSFSMEKPEEAKKTIDDLVSSGLDPEAIMDMGFKFSVFFREHRLFVGAQNMLTMLNKRWPNAEKGLSFDLELARLNVVAGDFDASEKFMDKMIDRENTFSGRGQAAFLVAEEFLNEGRYLENQGNVELSKKYYHKAIDHWKKVITHFSDTSLGIEANHMIANDYHYLGDYTNALNHYETVLEKYPDHEYAWNIQYMIGDSINQMKIKGMMPADEADPQIRFAFTSLLEDYPNSRAANAARTWLQENPELN